MTSTDLWLLTRSENLVICDSRLRSRLRSIYRRSFRLSSSSSSSYMTISSVPVLICDVNVQLLHRDSLDVFPFLGFLPAGQNPSCLRDSTFISDSDDIL